MGDRRGLTWRKKVLVGPSRVDNQRHHYQARKPTECTKKRMSIDAGPDTFTSYLVNA